MYSQISLDTFGVNWYHILPESLEEPKQRVRTLLIILILGQKMVIVAHISRSGTAVADVTYRAGLHVEVRVAKEFQDESVCLSLVHSENKELSGTWEEALDMYFNEGRFDSKDSIVQGEMRRVGSAREHKSLFRFAVHALLRDLEPHGYTVHVEFP